MAFGTEELDIATDTGSDDLDLGGDTGDLGDGSEGIHEDGDALDTGDGEDTGELDVANDGDGEGDLAEGEGEPKPQANDGRTLPADVKQALKAVQATNPTAAGKLRDAVFSAKAYRDVFATPADAVKAKDFLDGIGGEDGLKGLQDSLAEWAGVEKAFTDGSPDFVKRLVEASPEGFQKMVPQAINAWAEKSPEAYGYFRSAVALNAFGAAGLTTDTLRQLLNSESVKDNRAAKILVEDVLYVLNGMQRTASQFTEKQSQRNPEREKLDADRKAFEDGKQAEFESDLFAKTDSYAKSKAEPWLKQYFGEQDLPEGMKAAIDRDLETEIGNRLAQIPGFDARLAFLMKSRNGADALVAVQQQIDKVVSVAAKTVAGRFSRTAGTAKPGQPGKKVAAKPGQPGQPARNTGDLKLNSAPAHGQIDWSKTTRLQYISGSGTLKDGRKASW